MYQSYLLAAFKAACDEKHANAVRPWACFMYYWTVFTARRMFEVAVSHAVAKWYVSDENGSSMVRSFDGLKACTTTR